MVAGEEDLKTLQDGAEGAEMVVGRCALISCEDSKHNLISLMFYPGNELQ